MRTGTHPRWPGRSDLDLRTTGPIQYYCLALISDVIYAVLAVAAVAALVLIMWNFHRQKDFEGSDHVVPEEYD